MAHLLAPKPPNPTLPVYFNVDAVVGAQPAENRTEDVLLVQFAFHVLASSTMAQTPPEVMAAARNVSMTGTCDQATIDAIRAYQTAMRGFRPGQVADGRVSPSRGGYSYGEIWIIVQLNESMQGRHIDLWPRIDRIPGCPQALREMVIRQVVGT
jgi:hypothetical protein